MCVVTTQDILQRSNIPSMVGTLLCYFQLLEEKNVCMGIAF